MVSYAATHHIAAHLNDIPLRNTKNIALCPSCKSVRTIYGRDPRRRIWVCAPCFRG